MRNTLITELHTAAVGNMTELQAMSNQQLVGLCGGVPHDARLPPNPPLAPSTVGFGPTLSAVEPGLGSTQT